MNGNFLNLTWLWVENLLISFSSYRLSLKGKDRSGRLWWREEISGLDALKSSSEPAFRAGMKLLDRRPCWTPSFWSPGIQLPSRECFFWLNIWGKKSTQQRKRAFCQNEHLHTCHKFSNMSWLLYRLETELQTSFCV